jgi:hypothetical protein
VNRPPLKCVLWDFGDTLVDERWMWRNPQTVPQWRDVWTRHVVGVVADAWNIGDLDVDELAAQLAASLPMTVAEILAHCDACCANIDLYAEPWRIVRACALPQALVTLNPDLFSTAVVPAYRLDAAFDTIVTSWQERSLEKAHLCSVALERFGGRFMPTEALLIDNKADNVAAWRARGGRGYVFVDQPTFAADLDGELADLAQASR